MELRIGSHQTSCQIKRSKRKTISIRIRAVDQLEIIAPLYCSDQDVEAAILRKERWIHRQFAKLEALAANPVNTEIAEGISVLYLGDRYKLRIFSGIKARILLAEEELLIELPAASNKTPEELLRKWYIDAAKRLLTEKTLFWSTKIGVAVNKLSLRDQKTRWGSCSPNGNINYNWRIIMAPPPIVDYLIVHELCHLRFPNHSAAYWNFVASFLPDYKNRRNWLKVNGNLLSRLFRQI